MLYHTLLRVKKSFLGIYALLHPFHLCFHGMSLQSRKISGNLLFTLAIHDGPWIPPISALDIISMTFDFMSLEVGISIPFSSNFLLLCCATKENHDEGIGEKVLGF
jgi:hypothetical protein